MFFQSSPGTEFHSLCSHSLTPPTHPTLAPPFVALAPSHLELEHVLRLMEDAQDGRLLFFQGQAPLFRLSREEEIFFVRARRARRAQMEKEFALAPLSLFSPHEGA